MYTAKSASASVTIKTGNELCDIITFESEVYFEIPKPLNLKRASSVTISK